MTNRSVICAAAMGLLLATGCSNKSGGDANGGAVPPSETPAPAPGTDTERPAMTAADCEAKEGRVVGDIGDGAIHRPDYKCESGKAPIGSIKPAEGEPIAIEGAVCCPG